MHFIYIVVDLTAAVNNTKLTMWPWKGSNELLLHFFELQNISYCRHQYTRVGTLIVATIYLQLIQNRYMFRSFTVLHCSHQHCVQPVASDVEVIGYL